MAYSKNSFFPDFASDALDIRTRAHHAARQAIAAPLPRNVRGVLFDACNILYDDTVWRRWVLRLLNRVGLHTNYCSFFRIWDRDYLDDVHCGRREFREAFESFLRCVGLTSGQIDEVEAASHARRRQLEANARPLPGVRTTLWRLHQAGFKMGVICDTEHTGALIRERLLLFGIDKLFPALVSSIDLKSCMPDPTIYLAALDRLNLPAESVAFVGHDRVELSGAAAVGMATIAFNADADAEADVRIARFEELTETLGSPLTVGSAAPPA